MDINHLRNQIDEITLDMIKMLKQRNDISKEIGEIKKTMGRGITDEFRETSLRTSVMDLCDKIEFDKRLASKFLNFLFNESIKIQTEGKQTHLSIFRRAKELERDGKKIIHLEVGEPDFPPPNEVREALKEVFEKGFFKYGNPTGMPSFKESLANYFSKDYLIDVKNENIIISPGARFSIFNIISTLLNPGDEIIVIEPAWPAYKECAINFGIKVRAINTTLENNWEPSVEQIESVINANTKMIVLNYPNNPTGKILPKNLQDEIVKLSIDHKLYIISDEIYSKYAFKEWKSILSYKYDRVVATQSFSKSHSMTGFRIGCAIADPEIIKQLSKLQALCLTNVSESIQYVAMKALKSDISGNIKTIQQRLSKLTKMANEMGLDFLPPEGAMYLFVRINKKNFNGINFANDLLNTGIAVAPGEAFGDYKNFIRISAGQDEKILMEGMNILGNKMREME